MEIKVRFIWRISLHGTKVKIYTQPHEMVNFQIYKCTLMKEVVDGGQHRGANIDMLVFYSS